MKRFLTGLVLVVSICLTFSSVVTASDKVTPTEVVQKVNEAVQLVLDKGEEAAFDIFRDKNGPFVWKGTYLFVINFDGIMLMHPIVKKLEGKNQLNVKDVNGKMFNQEAMSLAKGPGKGWFDYYWVKPGAKTPSPKVAFVKAIPGKDMYIGCGVYDITLDEAKSATK